MQDLLSAYAATGFADFAGLSVTGSIPIKQELANQVIAQLLASATLSAPSVSATSPPLPVTALLRLVKKLELQAAQGVVTINFELRA